MAEPTIITPTARLELIASDITLAQSSLAVGLNQLNEMAELKGNRAIQDLAHANEVLARVLSLYLDPQSVGAEREQNLARTAQLEKLKAPISELALPIRVENNLASAQVITLRDNLPVSVRRGITLIGELVQATDLELLQNINGFGAKAVAEVKGKLTERDLRLGTAVSDEELANCGIDRIKIGMLNECSERMAGYLRGEYALSRGAKAFVKASIGSMRLPIHLQSQINDIMVVDPHEHKRSVQTIGDLIQVPEWWLYRNIRSLESLNDQLVAKGLCLGMGLSDDMLGTLGIERVRLALYRD